MENINLAKLIDHTLLKAAATEKEIIDLCVEAKTYGFATVCVNPFHVHIASKLLYGTGVGVATVIGFPLGATLTNIKVQEVLAVKAHGAKEIDMVVNLGLVKTKEWEKVKTDIRMVLDTAQTCDLVTKVIIETSLLTEEEKERMAYIVADAGADYIKTSTGYAQGGATVEDILKLKSWLNNKIKIKASGGIRTKEFAIELVKAGANRIGTSSGVSIVSK